MSQISLARCLALASFAIIPFATFALEGDIVVPFKNGDNYISQGYETNREKCTQESDTQGIILTSEPVKQDGYSWWKVDYDGKLDGWSADASLKKINGSKSDKDFQKGDTIITTDEVTVRPFHTLSSSYCGGTHYNKDSYALDFIDRGSSIKGREVVATSPGVLYAKFYSDDANLLGSYGNYVILKHGDVFSLYAHLDHLSKTISEMKVKGVVEQGTTLGFVGNTGLVIPKPTKDNPDAGMHLHFFMYQEMTELNDKKACAENGHYSKSSKEKASNVAAFIQGTVGKCAYKPEPMSGCVGLQEGDTLRGDQRCSGVFGWAQTLRDQLFTILSDGTIRKTKDFVTGELVPVSEQDTDADLLKAAQAYLVSQSPTTKSSLSIERKSSVAALFRVNPPQGIDTEIEYLIMKKENGTWKGVDISMQAYDAFLCQYPDLFTAKEVQQDAEMCANVPSAKITSKYHFATEGGEKGVLSSDDAKKFMAENGLGDSAPNQKAAIPREADADLLAATKAYVTANSVKGMRFSLALLRKSASTALFRANPPDGVDAETPDVVMKKVNGVWQGVYLATGGAGSFECTYPDLFTPAEVQQAATRCAQLFPKR